MVILVGIELLMRGEISLLYLVLYIIAAIKVKEIFDVSKEGIFEMYYIEPAVRRIKRDKECCIAEW